MSAPSLSIRLVALLVLWLAGIAPTTAAVTQDAIEAARAAVDAAELDDAARASAKTNLDAALEAARATEALAARRLALVEARKGRPARVEKLEASIGADVERAVAAWSRRLASIDDAETLERMLAEERRTLAELQAQADAAGAALAVELSKPAQAAEDIAALRRAVDEATQPVEAQPGEPSVVVEARRLRRAGELARAQAELELRTEEQDGAMESVREHELTSRELRQRMVQHQRRTEILQFRIAELGRIGIESRRARLTAQAEALADAPEVVALAAKQNLALGDELLLNHEALASERVTLAGIEEEHDYVDDALRDSRARIELGGVNEQVGRWLWTERRRLQRPEVLRKSLDETRVRLADLRVRMFTLRDERRAVADVAAAVEQLIETSRAGADDEAADAGVAEALTPLVRERAELLAELRPLLERRITTLDRSERTLGEQLESVIVLRRLLDSHLLWLPSHSPVNLAWLERVRDGARDLFKASRFVTTFELCVEHARERPIPWSGSLVLLAVLVFLRIRAPGRIAAQAIVTRDVRRDSYRATLRSLGWTLLAALPVPTALFLAGALLQQVGTPGRFSDSLGRSFSVLVVPVLALQVLRWSVIDAGLAHAHFRWLKARRETLRRWLPLAGAMVLPAFFVVVFASTRTVDVAIDVQARIGIFVALVALAFVLWSVLAAGRVWIVRGVTVEPSLARRLTRLILPVCALFASALALTGYVYTAALILRSLLETFAVVVAVALVLGMASRWFLLGERRLALRRAEEKRSAAQVDVESGEAPGEASDEAVTLEQVGEHTSRLLRTIRLALLAAGLVYVWSDMLPAVYRLDEVVLWTVSESAADGTTVAAPVTLSAVMLGILALALAVIGSRNLPGLIELSLLSRTGIDAASRYAVTSVLRYAIVIGGSIVGLGLLGLRWSQLQWMAAALTVGLGFGLQEIFANFVSGLILLFERPFRVGDIITVGDLSGRVTRIRTRATTILDFDNKEIVIPNKAFITGELVNWTLTDTTTRLTIKVGADYDADPALVRRLLLQAAAEDARVLKDPAPTSWLLNFGDSNLDFELRVFVGTIGDRLEVQNALNLRILELFAQNGIVISYPQVDVHLRDVSSPGKAAPEAP